MIEIKKPTSIVVSAKCLHGANCASVGINVITVTDLKDGILYYIRKFDTPKDFCTVRIPDKGNYEVKVNGKELGEKDIKRIALIPSKFLLTMPTKDRNRLKPYTVVWNDGAGMERTPARNNTHKGIIEVSSRMKSMPLPSRKFIMFHEIGHFFYADEANCDMYAVMQMLKRGYNRTMILYTLNTVLKRSEQAIARISTMFENLNT